MSDAKALWWPPLTRVYDALVEANARDASADAKKIQVGVRLAAHAHFLYTYGCLLAA